MPPDVVNILKLGQVESFPESHWSNWEAAAGFWQYFWMVAAEPFPVWNPTLLRHSWLSHWLQVLLPSSG